MRPKFRIALLICTTILLGNYHIVTDTNTLFIKRPYFGFSDVISSIGACTSTSWITAQNNHPSLCKALEEEGYLETNNEMKERINNEWQNNMKEYQDCIITCDSMSSENTLDCINSCS